MRKFADPTIPKKGAERRRGNNAERKSARTTIGRLIDYGTHVKLVSNEGNDWSSERVTYCSGSFGFGIDGLERNPRLWKYDPTGKVLVEGDMYVIDFVNDDPEAPIIRGGVRSLKPFDEFFTQSPIGADSNRFAARLAAVSPVGVATGHVEVEGLLNGNNLEIRVGGAQFKGPRLRIRIDGTTGAISIGKGLETHQVPFGEVLVQALADLAADIIAVNTAIPTLVPVPAPALKATTLLVDTAASLAAGPPMLSTIVKVQ